MAKQLTAAAVERLRPDKERREVPDGGCSGLYLIIQPSGVKSWAMRFRRPSGKSAKLTLGPVDLTNKEVQSEPVVGMPLTLASARSLATELHRQRAMGKDVVATRHREKLERAARGAKTSLRPPWTSSSNTPCARPAGGRSAGVCSGYAPSKKEREWS